MTVRIKLNRKGVGELLKSPEVQADLKARAERIAAGAGEGFVADSEVGKVRARAAVYTETQEAMKAESERKALTRAIDAGR